jgi:hypothetical protein
MSTPRKTPPATASGKAKPAASAQKQFGKLQIPAHWDVDENSAKSGMGKLRLPANGRVVTQPGTLIGIVGFSKPKR